MKITIVLPTYNEAENLPKLVSALFSLPLDLSLLIVDDNSPDGTGQIAEELAQEFSGKINTLHRIGKMGLRSAYLEGFAKAFETGADAVVQMDADFSHDPAVLVEMARRIESCDVVIGSRYTRGGSLARNWPFWRKALSAFERMRSSGYVFLVEMAYVAWLMGFNIEETPIHFADRRWGKSKMSFRIQLEAAVRIWDVRWHYRDLRGMKLGSKVEDA